MMRALAPWGLAILGGVLLALSFGFQFPESNQNTYLVHGLVLNQPSLLPHDWYVREATDYHHAFSLLVARLFAIEDGPEPFVALDVLLVVAGALAWFAMLRRLYGPQIGSLAYLSWIGFAMLTRTSDVMASYVFGGYLQPSSIGTAAYLWALALFVDANAFEDRRRRLPRLFASGGALAVGSVFHLNFLVLGVATLGLSQVALHRGRVWTRDFGLSVAAQMALPALVLVWAAPQLIEATRGPTAEALPILFDIRAPHHFRPTLGGLAPFFAWQGAAWLVVLACRNSHRAVPAALVRLLAGVGGFLVAASLLSTVVRVPQVAQVFPWRLAPVGTGLAFVVLVGAALRGATAEPALEQERGTLQRVVAFAVAAALSIYGAAVAWWQPAHGQTYLVALAGALVLVTLLVRIATARGHAGWQPVIAAACVTVVVAGGAGFALRDLSLEVEGLPKGRMGVATWARDQTPNDAVFAVPPDLESFRLVARRSIVVDWKSSGMLPRDVVEWAHRVEAVSGRPLTSRKAALQGYADMTAARALDLGERYGVDYLVFDRNGAPIPAWSAPLYQNARYAVLPLPGGPPNEQGQ